MGTLLLVNCRTYVCLNAVLLGGFAIINKVKLISWVVPTARLICKSFSLFPLLHLVALISIVVLTLGNLTPPTIGLAAALGLEDIKIDRRLISVPIKEDPFIP